MPRRTPFATAPRLAALVVAVALLIARALPAHAGAATLPTDFSDTALATGLDTPTSLAEVPDPASFGTRRILYVEQVTARVRLVVGAVVTTVGTVPGVNTNGSERGLLGIAVDPGFPARPYIYVHCTDQRSGTHVAISRFTLAGDLAYAAGGAMTFDPATRYDLRADFPDDANNHNGGAVRFGPDGKLYVSLGDDAKGCPALDLAVAVGKILRLDVSRLPATGSGPAPYALLAPADNPFAANTDSIAKLVWVEGLRNPFRFSADPQTGALAIGDVGQSAWEEEDFAPVGGMNMGWPVREGPDPYTTCPQSPPAPATGPIAYFAHPSGAAIIGGPLYRRLGAGSQRFPPGYDGDIFFLDYYGAFMRRVKLTGGTWAPASAPGQPNATDWATGLYAVSDIIEASDGTLWYCRQYVSGALTGELRRIAYVGTASVSPPAAGPLAFAPPRPNPGHGAVTLAWSQPADAAVRLTVFAADGRRVRTLLPEVALGAGPHSQQWDGLDADGHAVRAGVYFARLETGGESRTTRLTLLR